jgi:hypothetical protein
MNLKEAIDALLSGREISPELREQLTGFDPESLREELNVLRSKLEEQENAQLTAEELLKKQLETALSEKEELQQRHAALERSAMIRRLADKSGCEDPDYLDYLAGKEKVDLSDGAATEAFLARMAERCPAFFRTSLHPGSGVDQKAALLKGTPDPAAGGDRISRILRHLETAPALR